MDVKIFLSDSFELAGGSPRLPSVADSWLAFVSQCRCPWPPFPLGLALDQSGLTGLATSGFSRSEVKARIGDKGPWHVALRARSADCRAGHTNRLIAFSNRLTPS